jgi:hypothetical protein
MYDIVELNNWDGQSMRSNFLPTDKGLKHLNDVKGIKENINWINDYRMLWSRMVSLTGERTLQTCIIPPKTAHVDVAFSAQFKSNEELIEVIGLCSSLVIDWFVRTTGVDNIRGHVMGSLPCGVNKVYRKALSIRVLMLNALTDDYSQLWEAFFKDNDITNNQWSKNDNRLKQLATSYHWNIETPLKNLFERRQALIEIDTIVAMALDLTLEELILIYNVQFPVLQQNEDDTWYDTTGNIVFTCSKGLTGVGLDRPVWNTIKDLKAGETYEHTIEKSELYHGKKVTYHAPFDKCDRVEDYKVAWKHFEEVFKEEER